MWTDICKTQRRSGMARPTSGFAFVGLRGSDRHFMTSGTTCRCPAGVGRVVRPSVRIPTHILKNRMSVRACQTAICILHCRSGYCRPTFAFRITGPHFTTDNFIPLCRSKHARPTLSFLSAGPSMPDRHLQNAMSVRHLRPTNTRPNVGLTIPDRHCVLQMSVYMLWTEVCILQRRSAHARRRRGKDQLRSGMGGPALRCAHVGP